MPLETRFENNRNKRKNGLVIQPDIGWAGPKPAYTKAEKIAQIKNEFIDERALLVVGATEDDFAEYPKIPAYVSAQRLIKCVEQLNAANLEGKILLIITDFDIVSERVQAKFVPLLKERQIMAEKLPDCVQIVIPVADENAVCDEIKALSFELKV